MPTFIQEHKFTNRLHVCLWLLRVYVIPASMYASQIWATSYLRQGHEMENCIQKGLIRFYAHCWGSDLQHILGVCYRNVEWSLHN